MMFVSQAPVAPHTQLVEELWGAEPSAKSHTGPVTDPKVKLVLSSLHWLNGA